MTVSVVVFDIGNVLYRWDPRILYERLISDDRALEAFLCDVVTPEWHFQHDLGRPFAETSAELIAQYPQHGDLIRAWGPRFSDSVAPMDDSMRDLVSALDDAKIPLFAITNFSAEFWPDFRAEQADIFDRFQDIIVSGKERLVKPDPAIYQLAFTRFGIAPEHALFIDDRQDNVEAARALGMVGHHFTNAPTLKTDLIKYGLL